MGLEDQRGLFWSNTKGFKENLGLYLTKIEIGSFSKFNGFAQPLGLYLKLRSPFLFPLLSPLPLIIRMPLPPLLHIIIPVMPVSRIILAEDAVVFLFPQSLALH
jgi:hypothetical protein